jgi:transcriptional regulator with XRE-family HTH domain
MQELKALRKQAGLSQRALALQAGVAYKTVQLVEAGHDTRWSTLQKLAKALRMSPATLVKRCA